MNPQGFFKWRESPQSGSSEPGNERRKGCKTDSLSKPPSAKKARKGEYLEMNFARLVPADKAAE